MECIVVVKTSRVLDDDEGRAQLHKESVTNEENIDWGAGATTEG